MCLGWFLFSELIDFDPCFDRYNVWFFLLVAVPMFVIGIIETQFFAYLQLIRFRLQLLNNLLTRIAEMANFTKNASKFATANEVARMKFYSFKYFASEFIKEQKLDGGFKSLNFIGSR